MTQKYYDLHINPEDLETVNIAERLGWGGICVVKDFDTNLREFSERIKLLKEKSKVELFIGAEIKTEIPQEIPKKARTALEYVDIILVSGGVEGVNRAVSECWEIDILCHPERTGEKDQMDYKNSGIDHVTAKFMSERFIAIEINFSEVLNSSGVLRSRILGRMRQNLVLAKKYNVPVVITSGARDVWGLRAPRELIAFGISLGMKEDYANACVEKIPGLIIKKAKDRKDPNVIMEGLEVVSWGNLTHQKKKMYGWY